MSSDIQPFIERAQNSPVMQGNGIWHSRELVHMNKEVRKEVARGVVATVQDEIEASRARRRQAESFDIADCS